MRPGASVFVIIVTLLIGACTPTAVAPAAPSVAAAPSPGATGAPSATAAPRSSTSPVATNPATTAPSVPPAAATDIVTFRGGAARTGVMPGPGPSGKVGVRWTFRAGDAITSQVAVVGQVVYLVSSDGILHALDLGSGAERWHAAIGVQSGGSPSVAGGLVIVPALDGAHAFSAVDGTPGWASAAPGPARGTPAVVDGTAVFSGGGNATALDVATGAVRWSTPMAARDDSSVAAADGTVILGQEDGVVLGLSLADGSRRWRVDFGDYARLGTPAIADGRVFLASLDGGDAGSRHITALDLVTGKELWRFASPGDKPSYTPAVAGGLAITEGEDGHVTALDEATGKVRWQSKAPGGLTEIVPAISDGAVYGASNDGFAFAMDARTGAARWQVPIQGVPYGAAITSGLMLVGTDAGTLYAIGGPPG